MSHALLFSIKAILPYSSDTLLNDCKVAALIVTIHEIYVVDGLDSHLELFEKEMNNSGI